MTVVQLMIALAAVCSVIVSLLAFMATRKKDVSELKVEREVQTFNEIKTMNDVLRAGLNDAQTRADALNRDLDDTNMKLQQCQRQMADLNAMLNIALANVALLDNFIEEHVPTDVPRPRLRRMI